MVYIYIYLGTVLLHSLLQLFYELSLVGLALDLVD